MQFIIFTWKRWISQLGYRNNTSLSSIFVRVLTYCFFQLIYSDVHFIEIPYITTCFRTISILKFIKQTCVYRIYKLIAVVSNKSNELCMQLKIITINDCWITSLSKYFSTIFRMSISFVVLIYTSFSVNFSIKSTIIKIFNYYLIIIICGSFLICKIERVQKRSSILVDIKLKHILIYL